MIKTKQMISILEKNKIAMRTLAPLLSVTTQLGLLLALSSCARVASNASELAASAESKDFITAYADLEVVPEFQGILKQYQRYGASLSDGTISDTLTIKGKVVTGYTKMLEISAKGLDAKAAFGSKSYQERLAAKGMLTSKLKATDIDMLVSILQAFVEVRGDLAKHKDILSRYSSDDTLRAVNTAMVLEAVGTFSKRQQAGLSLGGGGNAYVAIASGATALAKIIVGGVTDGVKNIDLAKSIEEHAKLINLCTKSRTDLNNDVTRILSCQQSFPNANACDPTTASGSNPIQSNGKSGCADVSFKCQCQDSMEPGKPSCFWVKWAEPQAAAAAPPPAATQGASRGVCTNL